MTAGTEPLRLASLGVGRIVDRGLLPGVAASERVELVALASERPGAAAGKGREAGLDVAAVDGYEAVLARDDVQAVYIPSRGAEHGRWTKAAAAAGKHVLCEKPLAVDAREAAEMVAACREADVVLMEAFMWRHQPRSLAVRELVRSGELGSLRLVLASFAFDIDRDDWRLDPAQAGGCLFDVGCYGVDAARFFTGQEPTHVVADARLHTTGADMTTRVGLTFPSGVLANVDCSFETPYRCEATLVGTEGVLHIPDVFLPNGPPKAILTREGQQSQTLTFEDRNAYAGELDCFAASVARGELLDPAEDGTATMQILDDALRQIRGQHREVSS